MKKKSVYFLLSGIFFSLSSGSAQAHVPYLELFDYSDERPFFIRTIENSIAAYAWLETGSSGSQDIDTYVFVLTEPAHIFVESLVPVCPGYEDLLPSFAIAGPGLPAPAGDLPFELPPGYGALVVENYPPGTDRPTFYEPFGGKDYYDGPEFDQTISLPGIYHIYFWDPAWIGGDYVAVFGYREVFSPRDIMRALINTPKIRRDEELHTDCK